MRRPVVALLLTALIAPALAHDLWLVPPEQASLGNPVELELAVGMDFPTSLNALSPERVQVRTLGPGGVQVPAEVLARESQAVSVARFAPDRPGTWLVAAETRTNRLEMTAAKFNDYLLHDGLPHVLAGRMDRGELDQDAVEQYSKYVKALVAVGDQDQNPSAALAVLGQRLEIVPLADPLAAPIGGTLRVRVLFEGQPLQRANLCWDHPGNGEDFTGQTWTNAKGEAMVPIVQAGPMTLRLVHMTQPKAATHEWESFWSSLTFHVR